MGSDSRSLRRVVLTICLLLVPGLAWAQRTVKGKIMYMDGSAAAGVLVQAWDSDTNEDDYMGGTLTDSDGRYSIEYESGHWDPAPHRNPVWRPDIYIKVYRNEGGVFHYAGRSKTQDNRPHREDTIINLIIEPVSVETCRLERSWYTFFIMRTCKGGCLGGNVCSGLGGNMFGPEKCTCAIDLRE